MPIKDSEVVIERPDGSRLSVLMSVVALRNCKGEITGALNCFQDITARKRTEDELRRSRQDLEDFFENGTVALHWVGADGTILRANQAELDLLGYSRDEYVGRHIAEFHADRAAIDDILARLSRGDGIDKYPARLRAKDGSIRHVLISSSTRTKDGRFMNTRCFTVDMTERKRAERISQQLAAIVESSDDAIVSKDLDGIIATWNKGAERLFGYTADEVVGKPITILIPEDRQDEEPGILERIRRGEHTDHYETVRQRKDGSAVEVSLTVSPVKNTEGRIVGASKIARDITERKRAEEALRASEARLSLALNAGKLGTWQLDLQTGTAIRSLRHDQIFGYDSLLPEWSYAIFLDHVLPDDRVHVALSFNNAVETLSAWAFQCRIRRADGEIRWIEACGEPHRDASGTVTHLLGIVADITERKQTEERLMLLAREVDHRAKNMLAVIQSMVHFTRAKTAPDFATAINGRIRALAHAHSLLSESRWKGADLKHLVAEELAPYYSNDGSRFRLDGTNAMLAPSAAQTIAMAIHELATNAAKYGAFSTRSGQVSVEWSRYADGNLILRWIEAGGPTVRPPSRQGFGTQVIERTIQDQLDGTVRFDWRPEGLVCEIDIPAAALVSAAKSPSGA